MAKKFRVGDFVNGNEITSIWGETSPVYTLICGHCGKEFTKSHNKMQCYPPKSCGCQVRAAHERSMKSCFKNRPTFADQNWPDYTTQD